ncbi:hypothetical protein BDR06DRAFT_949545 [Suillus hirtellus]|nr:hypothetical protein BDR06DRAFT_949545 [Suillus hirtellus]
MPRVNLATHIWIAAVARIVPLLPVQVSLASNGRSKIEQAVSAFALVSWLPTFARGPPSSSSSSMGGSGVIIFIERVLDEVQGRATHQ